MSTHTHAPPWHSHSLTHSRTQSLTHSLTHRPPPQSRPNQFQLRINRTDVIIPASWPANVPRPPPPPPPSPGGYLADANGGTFQDLPLQKACSYVYLYIYTYIHTYMHAYMHTYTEIQLHTHTHQINVCTPSYLLQKNFLQGSVVTRVQISGLHINKIMPVFMNTAA